MDDIRSILLTMPASFFSHVYREANSVAHRLVRFALIDSVHCSWFGNMPCNITNIMTSPCTD